MGAGLVGIIWSDVPALFGPPCHPTGAVFRQNSVVVKTRFQTPTFEEPGVWSRVGVQGSITGGHEILALRFINHLTEPLFPSNGGRVEEGSSGAMSPLFEPASCPSYRCRPPRNSVVVVKSHLDTAIFEDPRPRNLSSRDRELNALRPGGPPPCLCDTFHPPLFPQKTRSGHWYMNLRGRQVRWGLHRGRVDIFRTVLLLLRLRWC